MYARGGGIVTIKAFFCSSFMGMGRRGAAGMMSVLAMMEAAAVPKRTDQVPPATLQPTVSGMRAGRDRGEGGGGGQQSAAGTGGEWSARSLEPSSHGRSRSRSRSPPFCHGFSFTFFQRQLLTSSQRSLACELGETEGKEGGEVILIISRQCLTDHSQGCGQARTTGRRKERRRGRV